MRLESTPNHGTTDGYVNHVDDDDGEDDIASDNSRLNTPAKGSIASHRSSCKKRTRTKSTTSTSSKFSLSAIEILNDVNMSSDKLGLSGFAEDMDRCDVLDNIVALSHQLPDSPRSPSVPLLNAQFITPNASVELQGTATETAPENIISSTLAGPLYPEETKL
jgi:hypothetical protein